MEDKTIIGIFLIIASVIIAILYCKMILIYYDVMKNRHKQMIKDAKRLIEIKRLINESK